MTTLADGIAAYRIFAQAEGKSPQTIRWIMSSVTYFSNFLGDRQDICEITANDLRHFIITLQQSPKFLSHPYTKPRKEKLSPQSIETYARAIRAFFSNLHREELIDNNPMEKVKMPRAPKIGVELDAINTRNSSNYGNLSRFWGSSQICPAIVA